MSDYGFILTRHVNSEKTNKYWNHSVKLLQFFYPDKQIIIIDDNSNEEYLKTEINMTNVKVIFSEFHGRGELLPYYYFHKHKFFDNAIIIHDSVFFQKRIQFEKLKNIKAIPLWHFTKDNEDIENRLRIINVMKNNNEIINLSENKLIEFVLGNKRNTSWHGCFGVQSYITWQFLDMLERKYSISRMLSVVHCRKDRCCLERIFGILFTIEIPNLKSNKSLLGNIKKYCKWGYNYDEYMNDLEKRIVKKYIIKIWSGR